MPSERGKKNKNPLTLDVVVIKESFLKRFYIHHVSQNLAADKKVQPTKET